MDFIYVNILNEGSLPYLREKGPLFGYHMASGVYSILSRDPRLKMEITTLKKAEERKNEYLAKKNATILKEEEIIEDKISIEVVETKVDETPEITTTVQPEKITEEISNEADDAIDKILDEKGDIPTAFNVKLDETDTNQNNKVYSVDEIMNMTKAQLRQILKDRGYIRGPYAPKYQDNLEQLRTKVKKTQ